MGSVHIKMGVMVEAHAGNCEKRAQFLPVRGSLLLNCILYGGLNEKETRVPYPGNIATSRVSSHKGFSLACTALPPHF